ncbi:MAG: general secretion pathway protein GspK, partial [Limisphaerales bacterium]
MKILLHSRPRGIALIIVMIVIVVLGILAGAFAYTMRVEMRLARQANNEAQFEWLGRSGVELARFLVGEQTKSSGDRFDALCQKWAGGTKSTNDAFANISLENNQLGSGTFSIKITDLERKVNVNSANQDVLQRALTLIGVDAGSFPGIVDSILDWRDRDEDAHISGAESDYYKTVTPAYLCKNGWLDDLSELLLIRGITPEIYWGTSSTNH